MNNYSVSYNFPNDFLWGINLSDNILRKREDISVLYRIKDKSIQGVCLTLEWADFEPLKNNFEENLIESTRSLLSRIRSHNLEPILIINTATVPQWQNLEHNTKNYFFSSEKYNFVSYLSNAFVPYTNYFGLCISDTAFLSNKETKSELETVQNIREHIISIKNSSKIGIVLSSQIFNNNLRGFRGMIQSSNIRLLKESSADFFGISADGTIYNMLQNIFKDERKPLFILNDKMNSNTNSNNFEDLADKIFDMWHFYQKGWQILGYFTELNIYNEHVFEFFSKTCRNNSLSISSTDENLSEKWMHFLKD